MSYYNGAERFWKQAKRHLCNDNGIPKNVPLFLKEGVFKSGFENLNEQVNLPKKWKRKHLI